MATDSSYAASERWTCACRVPPSNSVAASWGPTDQKRLGSVNNCARLVHTNPPVPLSISTGKNAAFAMPICSFAAAIARSMAVTSGRRSISVDGRPKRNHRRWRGHQLVRDRDARRRLADEGRDRVLELRAPDADVDELRARRRPVAFLPARHRRPRRRRRRTGPRSAATTVRYTVSVRRSRSASASSP